MRSILVSTDVFAAIWRHRRNGEQAEDAILRRMLNLPAAVSPHGQKRDFESTFGFDDPRYGVSVPMEFEIFRVYYGKEYRARAIQGSWVLSETGVGYPTLSDLSKAIGAKVENAWVSWFYLDNGRKRPVSDLR